MSQSPGTLMDTSTDLIASLNVASARALTRTSHFSTDTTVVNHCVFCGSGALVGRSDGGVDCNVCQRSFTVMEQPMYSGMPAEDSGAGVETTPNDPLQSAHEFEPPEMDQSLPEEPETIPFEPVDDEPDLPFLAASGVRLAEDDFVLHHALRSVRGE